MERQLELGLSLRRAREAAGWTGDAVAGKLGISAPAYRRYERGEVDPSASTILHLAEIYGRSLDSLMKYGGVEERVPHTQIGDFQIKVNESEIFHIEVRGWVADPHVKTKDIAKK